MELHKVLKTNARYMSLLKQAGIQTVKDFMLHFPRAYENRSDIKLLSELDTDTKTVQSSRVYITEKNSLGAYNKKRFQITFRDEAGNIGYAMYFKTAYIFNSIAVDTRYIIVGKPTIAYGKRQFSHPEFLTADQTQTQDFDDEENSNTDNSTNKNTNHKMGRIYPIYAEILGIKPGRYAKNTRKFLQYIPDIFHEYLEPSFLNTHDLLDVATTIKNIHYPENQQVLDRANYRIIFDRLLRIQLYSSYNKKLYISGHTKYGGQDNTIQIDIITKFLETLPFALTNAQHRVIKECVEDIHSEGVMMRLLQGDVGSGKTIVAASLAWYCKQLFQTQTVFLAPLSVLAQQHYANLAKLFLPLGLRVGFLSGSLSQKQKEESKSRIASGFYDIIVGTHALLQDDVTFAKLGLVVIDEQHKFGVKQRGFLRQHNNPHILQMSATPIPRSLALAYFGEFDVSIIDELPSGRKEIQTKILTQDKRQKLVPWIRNKIHVGEKVFIVSPLVEESEKMEDIASVTQAYSMMQSLFPDIAQKIGMIHGKIKAKEKDAIMQSFKQGKYMILVATTVIEVGVDIPEATIMIIQNAERFGLSQLHQLRGRIGRNALQSYCFLETKNKSGDSYTRLKAMEDTSDGFKLAEIDLEYRGTGEILGTRQSGEGDIPLSVISNINFVKKVHAAAQQLLQESPDLSKYPALHTYIHQKMDTTIV